jgi:predicted transcriptional regulator
MEMKIMELIIKIGGNPRDDIRKACMNPKRNAKLGTSTLYLKSTKDLYEILSPQRMELLLYLTNHQKESNTITGLAKKLKRRQEAISRDAIFLEKHSLIKKTKQKQKVFITPMYETLNLNLSTGN